MKPHETHIAVETLQGRNARVESDKAWETSLTRRSIIAIGTYIIIGGYLNLLSVPSAWLHALVPPLAYILSTLSLPVLKGLWINKIYKPKEVV
jgi:uncharacterized protein (DUF983 family)